MQDSEANCGPAALRNALYAIGINRSSSECELLCNTSATNGTLSNELVEAIARIRGCKSPVVINCGESSHAIFQLGDALRRGRSVILCTSHDNSRSVDNEHYIAAIGLLGSRIIVADSASNELVESWTETRLRKRWAPDYWGVIL